MGARIYKPAKSAMQSGGANAKEWVLEFEPQLKREVDPLMGWTGSGDTRRQLRISFDTKEEAIAYAEKNGIAYDLEEPKERKLRLKAYADNFRVDRDQPWTH